MFKKIIILAVLSIWNNSNCAFGQLDTDRFNISRLTDAEFSSLQDRRCQICSENIANIYLLPDDEYPYRIDCQNCPNLSMFHKKCIINRHSDSCHICRTPILRPSSQDWFRLIENRDIDGACRALGIYGAIDINIENDRGLTALMIAAGMPESTNLVNFLIKCGASIGYKNSNGQTALMIAIISRNESVARLLIEHGADVISKSSEGQTALMVAASIPGNANIVRLLIAKGAGVNEQEEFGNQKTVLMFASMHNDENIARLLIEKGAHINALDNFSLNTALIFASMNGHANVVKLLIDNKANIDHQNRNGHTALMFASRHRREDVVKLLVDNKANVKLESAHGTTALSYAQSTHAPKNENIIALLSAMMNK